LKHVMFAVNEEYVLDNETIHPGDTVALIPPVSGG
jgi:sulfur-carrier protein